MRTRTTVLAALVAVLPVLLADAPAAAQPKPSPMPSPKPSPMPSPMPPSAATPSGLSAKELAAAKSRFEKANNLFKSKKYKEALEEFRGSYNAVASPNSHLYIARCLGHLDQPIDAYLELERVIAEASAAGDKYEQTSETAQVEREEIAAKIALISANITNEAPSATLTIGGRIVPAERWSKPFPVTPGPVEITLEATGKPSVKRSITANAGESKTISIGFEEEERTPTPSTPEVAQTSPSPLRVPAIILSGVGVLGFATFAVAGTMSNRSYKNLQQACGGSPCPQNLAADVHAGKTQQTLANVGLVAGAVGVAAGTTLLLLSLRGSKKTEATSPQSELILGPTWLGAQGTF